MTDTQEQPGPELIVREEIEAQLSKEDLAWIERCLRRIYPLLGCPPESEACVVLTDDQEIQDLNRTWRQIDEPTDVLSFAYQDPSDGFVLPHLLGDIILSLETAQKYAKEAQHAEWIGDEQTPIQPWTLQHELAFLIVHGFLHLLGFDHIEEQDEAVMRPLEREIFSKMIHAQDPTPRAERLAPPP